MSVVRLLGGDVAATPDELLQNRDPKKTCLIIAEANASQDFDLFEMWLETLHIVTVDLEWLSRSVGQYEPLNLAPYALCSDNSWDHTA